MSADPSLRVGWCPGALRPMASADGLILRVRPRLGRLSLAAAADLARFAAGPGAGVVELTNRANLQLRGLDEAGRAEALRLLERHGLLDAEAAAEAVRNIVLDPLAGLDPQAVVDVSPLATALDGALRAEPDLWDLPGKFGFVVDGYGRLPLDDYAADIRIEALRRDGPCAVVIRPAQPEAPGATGAVLPWDAAVPAALALARAFLAARRDDPTLMRMSHLTRRLGAAAVLRGAGLDPVRAVPRPPAPERLERVGLLALTDGPDGTALAVAAPFGRLPAASFGTLLAAAAEAGAAGLRVTPWRALILVGLAPAAARRLYDVAAGLGLVVDPADPRRAIAACTGAPGCPRATTKVLADAEALAVRLRLDGRAGIRLHVSGCAKGCAHQGKAAVTLVAQDGFYRMGQDVGAGAIDAGLPLLDLDTIMARLDGTGACSR